MVVTNAMASLPRMLRFYVSPGACALTLQVDVGSCGLLRMKV